MCTINETGLSMLPFYLGNYGIIKMCFSKCTMSLNRKPRPSCFTLKDAGLFSRYTFWKSTFKIVVINFLNVDFQSLRGRTYISHQGKDLKGQ